MQKDINTPKNKNQINIILPEYEFINNLLNAENLKHNHPNFFD